jgi:hypothetical protein
MVANLLTGTFASTGALFNLSLPCGYDSFEMVNLTDIGSTEAATPVMRAQGTSAMSAGSAYYNLKTSGAATNALELSTATGGFTVVPNSGAYPLGASVATTAITAANPAVVSTGSTTGLASNQGIVRIYSTTSMLQITAMDFSVGTVVTDTSFGLRYLNASGFAAPGTTGSYRIVPFDQAFYPRTRTITAITAANPAVVTMSVTHGMVVGEYVRMVVPTAFGMTQMNGLQGKITAVTTGSTNTITLDIDSSAFTAFAFPTSANSANGLTFAQVVPIAETATLLTQAETNNSFTGVQIGTTVQTSGKTYQWFARKGVNFGLQTSL